MIDEISSGAAQGTIIGFFQSMGEPVRNFFRKMKLRKLLKDPRYEFRTLEQLRRQIGCDAQKTTDLLVSMRDVRRNEGEKDSWTLKPVPRA